MELQCSKIGVRELQKMLRKELEIEKKKKNTCVCSSTASKWELIPMRTCYG